MTPDQPNSSSEESFSLSVSDILFMAFSHDSPQPHKSVHSRPCDRQTHACVRHSDFEQSHDINSRTSAGATGRSIQSMDKIPFSIFHPCGCQGLVHRGCSQATSLLRLLRTRFVYSGRVKVREKVSAVRKPCVMNTTFCSEVRLCCCT